MVKKQLYPKTERYKQSLKGYQITEKLDGSNLGLGNFNGKLLIAQRNNVFLWDELNDE